MRFGVDTFIWSEVFSEKDLWVITKAEELGFSTIDIAYCFGKGRAGKDEAGGCHNNDSGRKDEFDFSG